MTAANQANSSSLYHTGADMQDQRYYYGTTTTRRRRGYQKDPAYQAKMVRRDALRLRATIAEIEHSIMVLERSIEVEPELVGVKDRTELTYPTSARAMAARLENLRITRAALVSRLIGLEAVSAAREATALPSRGTC
jgi:hypothetical protein